VSKAFFSLILLAVIASSQANEQARVEKNVVYGMYSGLALLMDVHHPAKPNGRGVVFISGSGWQAPMTYGATGLKEQQIDIWGPPLLQAGYTVFAINHRAAPRFHYPAAVEDVQRAIRFVRHQEDDITIISITDPPSLNPLPRSARGCFQTMQEVMQWHDAFTLHSSFWQSFYSAFQPPPNRRLGEMIPPIAHFILKSGGKFRLSHTDSHLPSRAVGQVSANTPSTIINDRVFLPIAGQESQSDLCGK